MLKPCFMATIQSGDLKLIQNVSHQEMMSEKHGSKGDFRVLLELAWGSASHPASLQTLRPLYVQLIQGVCRVSLSSDLM